MASLTMMMLQSGESSTDMHVLMACFILITVVLVVQAIVLIGAAMGARKTQERLLEVAEELKKSAVPFLLQAQTVVLKTNELIDDVGPAIRSISRSADTASANVAAASETLKIKAQEFNELTTEIKQRTQLQVRRVDGMVTGTLEAMAEIAGSIHRAILVPVREINGVVNGIKAGLDALRGRAREFGVMPGGRSIRREDETAS